MSGRTMWLAQDVGRHRRALMVELRAEHGAVAVACDTVLCAHAKEQNDGGAIRDGFAAVAAEAGCSKAEARAFIEDAAEIGWLDDLAIDEDGRRFRCRVSGWRNDQDKAYAAWRKREQRDRQNGDMSPNAKQAGDTSRPVPECPITAQHSTAQENNTGRERPKVVKYGGKTVKGLLLDVTEAVLADFNEREGTTYKPYGPSGKLTEPHKRIVGALIDRPEIGATQALRINELALQPERRFWDGPAQPGNVWGPGVVDRNVALLTTPTTPRQATRPDGSRAMTTVAEGLAAWNRGNDL